MERPTIADLARAAKVSISTVDRVLNGRDPVRPQTAERVLAAAEAIGFYATGVIRQRLGKDKPDRTFGFLLQQRSRPFYQLLGNDLAEATKASTEVRGRAVVDFADDLTPGSVADRLIKLGKQADAIAVVTADHPHISRAIDHLNSEGVPVFALVSDLTAPGRAGYVGLDNWKVGRTAAWAMLEHVQTAGQSRHLRRQPPLSLPGCVRDELPVLFPRARSRLPFARSALSLEDARYAYEHTLDLLKRNPDLVGLYIAGGGIRGIMQALRDEGPEIFGRIVTIGLDLMDDTRSGLIDGVLKLVLAHPMRLLAETTVNAMVRATEGNRQEPSSQFLLPFDFYTAVNL